MVKLLTHSLAKFFGDSSTLPALFYALPYGVGGAVGLHRLCITASIVVPVMSCTTGDFKLIPSSYALEYLDLNIYLFVHVTSNCPSTCDTLLAVIL